MLKTRLMPSLLMSKGSLVKTIKFKGGSYVGDPVNAVRIFNQKEVDELILLDIHATLHGIDFDSLEKIVGECFMPICYGGGVRCVEDMRRLYALGIEKISLGAAAFEVPGLVEQASKEFGAQAVVVTLDVKKNILGKQTVRIRNGTYDTKISPKSAAANFVEKGVGELIVYSIDNDGTWRGFDLKLIQSVAQDVAIPVVAIGGAGSFQDIKSAVDVAGASAVGIGSMAVFQAKDLGVLIKFPNRKDQEKIFE